MTLDNPYPIGSDFMQLESGRNKQEPEYLNEKDAEERSGGNPRNDDPQGSQLRDENETERETLGRF